VGTLSAIGLVLVSPNMTYPLQVKATQERIVKAQDERIAKLNADLPGLTDAAAIEKAKQGIAAAEKAKSGAQGAINALGGATTSLVGLTEPIFSLRNPGLISIPLGFLAVLIGSLLYRDRRAEEMWDELYVRSHTGIGRSGASAH
jgi:cation/acetate symporter